MDKKMVVDEHDNNNNLPNNVDSLGNTDLPYDTDLPNITGPLDDIKLLNNTGSLDDSSRICLSPVMYVCLIMYIMIIMQIGRAMRHKVHRINNPR